MGTHSLRSSNRNFVSYQTANGYILPEGRVTPNAIFVGGIDTRASANEMKEFFSVFGTVKEVKIITYRGGLSKGYGFVYFTEDVNIKPIIAQCIFWKGKPLKIGPAIIKQRGTTRLPRLLRTEPWMSPTQYFCCNCCSPNGCMPQTTCFVNDGNQYYPVRQAPTCAVYRRTDNQETYSYARVGSFVPQMPVNAQNGYTYQTHYTVPYVTTDFRTQPGNQSVECDFQATLTVA
ncbi:deleted in azoospermia-like isoform X2 [Vanacampus margaritifer]